MDPIITLTTDFGNSDWFVGAMKGAILSACPEARLVDICHEITRHDVREAALVLLASVPHFPDGTIHVAVVDPGVGGPRRPVAIRTGRAFFVAPDNGILSYVLEDDPPNHAVSLQKRCQWASPTFHGRDVFGPVAGELAAGAHLESLGAEAVGLELWKRPRPKPLAEDTLEGEVLHVDRFGNLITSFGQETIERVHRCLLSGGSPTWIFGAHHYVGLAKAYADVSMGEFAVLWGSLGFAEICAREDDAASLTGLSRGSPVILRV